MARGEPVFEAQSFAACRKRSAGADRPLLDQAAPTINGSGGGDRGVSFRREPVMQATDSETRAIPLPASTAAIRLVTLSCSSATRGLALAADSRAATDS